jgi:hypothetical protein
VLRRLVASARRQDWFAVAVELVVVVAGIFIGLQVANWNEGRKAARLAGDYRASLAADLATDEATMRAHADYFEVIQAYGSDALAWLDRPTPVTDAPDASRLVTAFMIASSVWEYRQPRPTYEDLKATGNLPLLGDTALRVQLVNYYSGVDSAAVQWDLVPGYRRQLRSIVPAEAQRLIMQACETVASGERIGLVMHPDCQVDLLPWDPVKVLNEIAASPGIKQELTYWMSQLRLKIQLFELEADAANAMRRRVLDGEPR